MSAIGVVVSLRAITACCASLALSSAPILRNVAAPGGVGDSKAGLVNKGGKGFGDRDFDPQTVADRRSQRFIEGGIRKAFPGVRIVGEEGDLTNSAEEASDEAAMKSFAKIQPDLSCLDNKWKQSADTMIPADELCVWIDPLDGTREFTEGRFEYVSTLVGVTWKGKPVAGVISEPYYYDYHDHPSDAAPGPARAIWGSPLGGVGAHVLGQDSWKPGKVDNKRCVVLTSTSRTKGAVLDTIKRFGDRITEHRLAGGSGHKMARLIDGLADVWLYPVSGTSKWDTCAGEAIMESIGGHVTDAWGSPLVYDADSSSYLNSEGVISAMRKELLEQTIAAAAPSVGPAPSSVS